MRIDPQKTALLVLDMQNDFVEESALLQVKTIRNGLVAYKEFIGNCREKGMSIFYTRHTYFPGNTSVEARLFPVLMQDGLRKGTRGWDIAQEIYPKENDVIINKTRFDAFYQTNLEKILREKEIENIIISGTMTQVCCESTARSAMYRDFNVLFLSDLTFSSKPEMHINTLKVIDRYFGQTMDSEEALKGLQ
jgi:nicotinamidase-related amidase